MDLTLRKGRIQNEPHKEKLYVVSASYGSHRLPYSLAQSLSVSSFLCVRAKESMQNVSRSGEKGGPPAVGWWWKVECCMLSRWKVCRCVPSDMSCDIKLSNIACTAHGLVVLSYSPLMRRPLPESGSTVFRKTSQKKYLTL